MQIISLSQEERKEFEKKGFFVKSISFSYFIYNTLFGIFLIPGFTFCIGITYGIILWCLDIPDGGKSHELPIMILYPPFILVYSSISYFTWNFIRMNTVFISKKGFFYRNQLHSSLRTINSILLKTSLLGQVALFYKFTITRYIANIFLFMSIFIWIGMFLVISSDGVDSVAKNDFSEIIFSILLYIITYTSIIYGLFLISQYRSRYYQFNSKCKLVQDYTCSLHKKSNEIKNEFIGGMEKSQFFASIHTLLNAFTDTTQRIMTLIGKIEIIEKDINKGDLFDSEKYVESIRMDIIIPLKELKKFLESQREKLLESQKELSRVRVGENEESGNIELQSKRSEALITELDTNIGALSEMIGKMV